MMYYQRMGWRKAVTFSNYLEVHLVHLAKREVQGDMRNPLLFIKC